MIGKGGNNCTLTESTCTKCTTQDGENRVTARGISEMRKSSMPYWNLEHAEGFELRMAEGFIFQLSFFSRCTCIFVYPPALAC